MPTFSGPTIRLPFAPPLHNWRYDKGVTVYRKDGAWVETTDPYWPTIKTADIVAVANRPGGDKTDDTSGDRYLFRGGYVYTVSDAVAAELTTAGYAANLT